MLIITVYYKIMLASSIFHCRTVKCLTSWSFQTHRVDFHSLIEAYVYDELLTNKLFYTTQPQQISDNTYICKKSKIKQKLRKQTGLFHMDVCQKLNVQKSLLPVHHSLTPGNHLSLQRHAQEDDHLIH